MTHPPLVISLALATALFMTACAPSTSQQPRAVTTTAPIVESAAPSAAQADLAAVEPTAVEPTEAEPTAIEALPASPLRRPVAPVAQQSPLRPQIPPPTPSGVTGEAPQALLDAILDDAAQQTGLDRSALIIVQDQAVVWPDGSLGCPQPGMMYTMALVDGYHVLVQAGDQLLDYRVGDHNNFQRCP